VKTQYKILLVQQTLAGVSQTTLNVLEAEADDGWVITWVFDNSILLKKEIKAAIKKKK